MSKKICLDEDRQFHIKPNAFQIDIWFSVFDEKGEIRKDAPHELSIWGGYGNGKSAIYMIINYYLCIKYPRTRWLFCRQVGTTLEDSSIPQFLEMFPPEIAKYKYNKSRRNASFSNGSILCFRSFDGPQVNKIFSSSWDGVTVCQAEQVPLELILEFFGRLRGDSGIPIRMLMVEGNPTAGTWPIKRYLSGKMPKNCLHFQAPTDVNKENLPPDYIERMKENFSDEWVEAKIMGVSWNSRKGKVHPDFDEKFNIVNPFEIKDHWFKAIGMDHGYVNPACMLWGAVDEHKRVYIYDEFHESHQRRHKLVTANLRYGPLPTPADTSMKAIVNIETGEGTLWDDLIRDGINLIEVPKYKLANIDLINKLIYERRLFVFRGCEKLIEEIKNYIWMPVKIGMETNKKEEVRKKDDHACDALQYLIRYLHDIRVLTPEEKNYPSTLAYHTTNTYNENVEAYNE